MNKLFLLLLLINNAILAAAGNQKLTYHQRFDEIFNKVDIPDDPRYTSEFSKDKFEQFMKDKIKKKFASSYEIYDCALEYANKIKIFSHTLLLKSEDEFNKKIEIKDSEEDRQKNLDLEKQITEKSQELQSLRNQSAEQESKIKELTGNITRLDTELQVSKESVNSYLNELKLSSQKSAKLQSTVQQLEGNFALKELEINKLKESNQKLEENYKSLQNQSIEQKKQFAVELTEKVLLEQTKLREKYSKEIDSLKSNAKHQNEKNLAEKNLAQEEIANLKDKIANLQNKSTSKDWIFFLIKHCSEGNYLLSLFIICFHAIYFLKNCLY